MNTAILGNIGKTHAAEAESGKFETVDLSSWPKVKKSTCMKYWALFVYRHYFVGRDKHGIYGSPKCVAALKAIEQEILDQVKPYGDAPTLEVPKMRIEDITPDEFHKVYLEANTPILFKGAAKNWEAVKKWSPEFFKEHYGKESVPVRVRGNQLNEEALRYVEMTVAEVVDNIRKGGAYFPGHTEDIFNRNPKLRDDLDLKTLGEYLSTRDKRIMSTQIFLSGGGTRSGWHCTGGPNLFTMVYGRKEWTFVHPKHSMFMYPATRKDMFYSMSPIDWKKSHEEIEKEGYPLYRYIPKYTANLEPGDVLFSPHWWWHCVNTTEPSIGIASRAINKLIFGQELFSIMWVTSKRFRETVFTVLKSGWGSDKATGAKLAFEREQEFISKVSI